MKTHLLKLLMMLAVLGMSISAANALTVGGPHATMGFKCADCHKTDAPQAGPTNEACLSCHGSYEQLAAKTKPKHIANPADKEAHANPHESHNFYKVTQTTSDVVTSKDEIYSYLGFAHGTVDLAPVELKFNVYTGQNVGNLMANSGAATGSYYFNRHNAYTYGGWAQVGYTLNNKIKMFTGASYESNDTKESKVDDRMAAFANLQYAVSKNFKVVPEITYLNDLRSRTGAKEPQIYAAGVKWEMTF